VALLNALIHTVIDEGLVDEAFIRERTDNFEALKANVMGCSPEAMAPVCGIPGRDDARGGACVCHGQGVDDPVGHGREPACARHRQRALPDRAVRSITGQIGKPGSGLHPLRGQNNVQGASDAG
jgi:formate dehydrogenase major subunit